VTRHRPAELSRPWKGIDYLVLDEAGVALADDGTATIPYRQPSGSVHRCRYVAASGRTWWGPGEGLIPFGLETLTDPRRARSWALLVAEGESDALALREAFAGVESGAPVDGYAVLALPGATTWHNTWVRWLKPFPLVYLLGDGDQTGRAMNAAIVRDVPWARPVWLPDGVDARSLLQQHGPRAIDPLLDQADRAAHMRAAFILAHDLDEFEQLLAAAHA
jgi:hypothetical protein